jgi:hypothetical protein
MLQVKTAMTVYDGNQLPEAPTSVFQMVVSGVLHSLCFNSDGYGGLCCASCTKEAGQRASWQPLHAAADQQAQECGKGPASIHPIGLLTLSHLYTSSLHNGSLYSASNIFYVAVFGFSAQYLGKAFIELVDDSIHMDSIKAVYECLYMLARCLGRLGRHKAPDPPHAQPLFESMRSERHEKGQDLLHLEQDYVGPAWLSPWAQMNIFLAIAAQVGIDK